MAQRKRKGRLEPTPSITQPDPAPKASAADSQRAVATAPAREEVTQREPRPTARAPFAGEGRSRSAGASQTLASRVADAAAAQLLIFDELPEDERPRRGDRVLLVGLVWGGSTLVELEQIAGGDDLTVGRLFDLPGSKLPSRFRLVQHQNGGHVLTLPEEMNAEIHHGRDRIARLADRGRRIDAPFRGHSYPIGDDDRIVAQISPSLTLVARYVRATRQKEKGLLESVDIGFFSTLVVALLALGLFFLMVSIYGEVDLGGRGKDETVFVPGRTTVIGGLSREVINRVIQKHYNEIKYCYEKELSKDPGLYGKVTMLFVIDGTGRVSDALVQQTTMSSEPVESCMVNHVRRWVFPPPQGAGTVQVTYPYVFKSSGQ
jgi:TonB family protein